jgi:ankyrin repeat protein
VSLLLEGGANADLANHDGVTPLFQAAQNGHPEVVSLLIAHEAQLDLVTNLGLNALQLAAFDDRPEVCAILIAAGLDPAAQDNNGRSALSHYGLFLDNNDPDAWDGVDQNTRPRLSDDEKRDRRALLVAARDAFLLQKKREENWQRRAPLMHALTGSGLRLTAAQQAEHAAFQAAMDYAAPIAPVPVDRLRDIFSNEGFVRTITTFV